MKILFVITRSDTVGGAQVHVRDLAKSLIQEGHDILVITGGQGYYNRYLEKSGIASISCATLSNKIKPVDEAKTLFFIKKIIHQFQPDLVSTHSSKAGILGRLAANLANKPCLFTAHGWAFTQGVPEPSRSIYQILERLTEPLADKIICVSEYDRQIAISSGMSPERLLTVRNGMPDIPNELRANTVDSNLIRIVMIARFDKQKDHLTLINALQNLSEVHLDLVGDGPKLADIKTYVSQKNMSDRVKFLGYCDRPEEILAKAQIFTLISHWEGFPRTILEAMRAGLPVVASNVGGVSEAIIDGVNGYCVPRGDVNILQERLEQVVTNTQLRIEMSKNSRQIYESNFKFSRMLEETLDVYETVLKKYNMGR